MAFFPATQPGVGLSGLAGVGTPPANWQRNRKRKHRSRSRSRQPGLGPESEGNGSEMKSRMVQEWLYENKWFIIVE